MTPLQPLRSDVVPPASRSAQIRQVRHAFLNWPIAVLGGIAWKQFDLPPRSTTLRSRRGAKVNVPLRRDAGALYTALEVFAFGAYDEVGTIAPQSVVIDIGANLGAFLLWANERAGEIRGVAFEPDPVAFSFLQRNLAANGMSGVTAHAAAVGGTAGVAQLHRTGDGDGISTLHPGTYADQLSEQLEVPVVAFDALIGELGSDEVAILKLDCEGAEHDIVMDSDPASWDRIQRVALEYHPVPGRTVAQLEATLSDRGFRTLRREEFGPELGMLWMARDDQRPR